MLLLATDPVYPFMPVAYKNNYAGHFSWTRAFFQKYLKEKSWSETNYNFVL